MYLPSGRLRKELTAALDDVGRQLAALELSRIIHGPDGRRLIAGLRAKHEELRTALSDLDREATPKRSPDRPRGGGGWSPG